VLLGLLEETQDMLLGDKRQELRRQGRPRKDEEKGNHVTFFDGDRGNNAAYLTARLARDHPDVLARLEAGEFSSVRAAAKVAGIVKDQTPLQAIQRTWRQASADERRQIVAWLRRQGRQGGDRKSEAFQQAGSRLHRNVDRQGNSTAYLTARLARDHPDVLARGRPRLHTLQARLIAACARA
jgi:hypothetical protein